MRKILVLRGGALGDFIVTLPALAALRQTWPDTQIDLVGNTAAATLALRTGIVTHAESQHGAPWHQLYGETLPAAFKARLQTYDLIANFWPEAHDEISRHFPLRPDQCYLRAAAQPQTAPAARHFSAALQDVLRNPVPDWVRLRTPAPQSRLAIIHPGSGSPRKNWPWAHWLEIAAWLRAAHGWEVDVFLGEAERSLRVPDSFIVWRELALNELADRLATGGLFLGHDSGIGHLAGACCDRGLLLFGPTDPAVWAPPNPRFQVVRAAGTLAAVAGVDDPGPASPRPATVKTSRQNAAGAPRPHDLSGLSVAQVQAAITAMLADQG